jgi:hypothetical protein
MTQDGLMGDIQPQKPVVVRRRVRVISQIPTLGHLNRSRDPYPINRRALLIPFAGSRGSFGVVGSEDGFPEIQVLKSGRHRALPDILIGVHTQDDVVPIGNPGLESLTQVFQKPLLRILVNLLLFPEIGSVLAPDGAYSSPVDRAIGRD